jgi:hypothetical protein
VALVHHRTIQRRKRAREELLVLRVHRHAAVRVSPCLLRLAMPRAPDLTAAAHELVGRGATTARESSPTSATAVSSFAARTENLDVGDPELDTLRVTRLAHDIDVLHR